jgi:hypothetical protein
MIAETRLQRGDLLVSVRRALGEERAVFGEDVDL